MRNELSSIVCGHRFWHGPAPWIVALLVLANLGVWQWMGGLAEERRNNLASGDLGVFATSGRFDTSIGEALLSTWNSIPDATKQPLVVLSGMSQMFSINERQPGDETISEEMDDWLAPKGGRVYGLAAPNLCNEEALFLLLSLLAKPETTPKVFIYAACFDKMRNVELRPGYQSFLKARPDVQAAWKRTAEAYRGQFVLATDQMSATLQSLVNTDQTDTSFEAWLREAMAARVPVIAARKELNTFAILKLYSLRNQLLGIKNSSKRPIIKTRYDMNREFMQMMMDVCEKAGVQFITYVIPLNPLSENPYIAEEYAEFKGWLRGLAEARRVPFANLENLVPAAEWGTWMGGPDFKHFKGAGHRRTASKLLEEFGPFLMTAKTTGATP